LEFGFRSLTLAFVAVAWFLCASAVQASPPAITQQPVKRTVVTGADHSFTVSVTGTAPLAYQWRKDGSNLTDKTNSILALIAIQTNDAGSYSVVITNAEGAVTSAPVMLTVRLASDPAYPTPQGGWAYLYGGDAIAPDLAAALDGSWNHETDSWSGDGRGPGNGLLGGLSTSNGVVTIEDAVTTTTGGTFNNRRYYFTRNLAQDTAVTNASNLLNDGVTLTFRARLTPANDPLVELTNAPNGLVNNTDGKGMFGIRQAGGSGLILSFSLNQTNEDTSTSASFNFGQAGLHLNNLNGNVRSATVDPGEGGTLNVLPLDPAQFHEFWITIQDNGADAGTHRVSIYLDGSKTPTVFNVTAGSGYDGPATNYLALGLGSTAQRGGFDVDFFGYKPGVVTPSAFNELVGIVSSPVSQFIAEGQIATYNVGVTGTPPYSFQWYRNGAAIAGATNSAYSTPPVVPSDEGALFTVIVSNECNSVTSSPPAELHLLGAPVITSHPASLTVTNGDSATFIVTVASSVTPAYQWRFNGGNLASQTNASLLINPALPANAGNYDVIVANPSGSVTSTVAQLAVVLFDYGDAPDPAFPTLKASNGARHRIMPGVYLGAAIDADLNGQPNSVAGGDDSNGTDDEDGVTFLSSLQAGQPASVQVIASTNGLLNAWIDYDHNGAWTGPGEQIFTNAPLVAGTNTLALVVSGGAAPGATFARFRFDTAGSLAPDGPAADGEVEDYPLSIAAVADLVVTQTAAPNPVAVNGNVTCLTIVSNAGPSVATGIVTTNVLPSGVTFISVVSSQGSCLLLNGQVTCDLGSVVSGQAVSVSLVLKPNATGSYTNTVMATSAAIDFATANNVATVIVSAQEPPVITAQPQNVTVTNGGTASFTVTASGAAPLRYQWRRNGADVSGATNSSLTISGAQLSDAGTYTVQVINDFGIATSQGAVLTVLVPPSISAQPQSRTNLAGSTAFFSVTGAGTEPLSYQWFFNTTNAIAGATSPSFSLPNVQLTNAGAYCVKLSNVAGSLTSAVVTLTVIAMDFGDAPESYRTSLTNDGARHRVVAGIRLGPAADFEPDGQPDSTASGDDSVGVDDEDGVTFNTPVRAGQTVNLTVVAATNGVLNAWLDYNRNGSWADVGEQIFLNRNVPTGTNTLIFTVPAGASPGSSYARFRFSTAGGLSFTGEAPSGEVEDYAVNIEGVSDLAITRLTRINPVAIGNDQIYSITVSNGGPTQATGVTLTDLLPPGVIFVSADTSQGSCSHSFGTVLCALGTLNTAATANLQIIAIAATPGSLTNTVSIGGTQADLNTANNTLLAVAAAQERPAIIGEPQSLIVTNGGAATFAVTATGTDLRHQWRLNGINVAGATNATLDIPNAQPANAGTYTVLITNLVGGVTSAPAVLTVLGPATILVEPQSQTVLAGSNVTLSVTATGSAPLTYQWELDGIDLPGATSATLLLPNVQTNQAGIYRVRVTNPVRSVTSAPAVLTIWQRPAFDLQPQSQTAIAGTIATLTAQVSGTEPLRYQWFFNQTLQSGQTNLSISFTNVQTSRSGSYTLVATNLAGAATSAVAVLTIYEMDFGDAPEANGYPTTLAFNGARHRLLPGVRLGALADFETNGLPNATSAGDDTNGVDDEDGVFFPAPLLLGQTVPITLVATTNGHVDAWIDFNANGAWNDPGEQILAARPVTLGTNTLVITVPPGTLTGQRYARFRYSTAGGLGYDGFAPDGEVEDHRVTILPAIDLAIGLVDETDPVGVQSNLVYTMTVTNLGPSTATSVMLTNLLPPSMTYIEARATQGFCGNVGNTVFCPVNNIPPGGVVTMTLTVRPTQPGTYTNTAYAAATEAEANPVDNTTAQTTTVVGPAARFSNPGAIPVADAAGGVPGKGTPYPSVINVTGLTSAVNKATVTLSNISHQFAKDLDVMLLGPGGQAVMLMSDAGGSSLNGATLTFDDQADAALPGSGVILPGTYRPSNYGASQDIFPAPAPAGPYGGSLALFNNTDPNGPWSLFVVDGTPGGIGAINGGWHLDLRTADPISDLAVSTTAAPAPVAVNSNLVFTVAVTNRGPAAVGGVMLTNTLPPGITFLSATTTLGSCAQTAGVVTCTVGNLNAGAGAAATITVRPTAVGLLTNTARAVGNRLDPAPANNTAQTLVPVRLVTDLAAAQTLSTNLVLLGQPLVCTFNVTNLGPNPAANVRLAGVLPVALSFISASSTQGACTNTGGVVTCDLGGLAAGARAQIFWVLEPTMVEPVTNVAVVSADEIDPVPANNTAAAVAMANVATDVSIALLDFPDPVRVSNTLTYAITVFNDGPGSATGILLSNVLPANVSFLSAASNHGVCSNAAGVVWCQLGTLPPGVSAAVDIAVSPRAAGRLTNVAGVIVETVDAVVANNSAAVVSEALLPPVILVPPLNRTITNSASVTFVVGASGTPPLSYQWQYNGADIAGAVNASLNLGTVGFAARGAYRVRVSNAAGAVTSAVATLTVLLSPGISDVGDQVTDEDTGTGLIGFVVGDGDGAAGDLVVSAVSSDSNLVAAGGFVFGGGGSNRTVQVTPAPDRFGTTTITLQVRDASGLVATDSFVLTVRPVDDAPVIGAIANQVMAEDATLVVPFTVSDAETPAALLGIALETSNAGLVALTNITLGGAGVNRQLTIRPATNQSGGATITVTVTDTNGLAAIRNFALSVSPVNDVPTLDGLSALAMNEDGGQRTVSLTGISSGAADEVQTLVVTAVSDNVALIPNPVVTYTSADTNGTLSFTPLTNANGTATISVTVNDGGGSNSIAVRTFIVTVNPVNDLPVITGLADAAGAEDLPLGPLAFGVADVETGGGALQLEASSSNTNLVPDENIFLQGNGNGRTVTIVPATNQSGTATITITLRDGDGGTTDASFAVTFAPVNDAPTLDGISSLAMNEDGGLRTVSLTGIGSGAADEAQALVVTAVSDNVALIPNPVVTYTSAETNGTLSFAPLTNASGTATISVTVDDGGGSNNVTVRSFTVTVNPVNDLPDVSFLADQTIDENTATAPIPFTVSDVETTPEQMQVTISSSNTNLIDAAGLLLAAGPPGGGPNGGTNLLLTLRPATNQFGSATITVTATDTNGGSTDRSFLLTVIRTIVPPAITAQPLSRTVTNGAAVSFSVTASGSLPILFQWYLNGSVLAGETNATLSLANALAGDAGAYSVVASNPAGQVASEAAVLRVLVSPVISAIVRAGPAAEISFTSVAGLSYIVEFTVAADAAFWGALPPVSGTGGVLTVSDPAPGVPGRLYRVRVE